MSDVSPTGGRPSGLRNPKAAVRGVGAMALAVQGVVLLLAIVPLRVIGHAGSGGTVTVLGFAVASFALAGLLSHGWAWPAALVLDVALLATGLVVHLALTALGLIFALVWLYVLRVRSTVLGGPGPQAGPQGR
jgi:hypothetical protein